MSSALDLARAAFLAELSLYMAEWEESLRGGPALTEAKDAQGHLHDEKGLFSGRGWYERQGEPPPPVARAKDRPAEKKPPSGNPADLARKMGPLLKAGHGTVSLADLKDATGWDNATLHQAVNDLRRQGVLTGENFEGRAGTPGQKQRELAAGMDEGGNRITRVLVRNEDAFRKLLGGPS